MLLRSLAAVAFAALLALMVVTVSMRAASLRARARIEQLELVVKARSYELEHRRRELAALTTQPMLERLLHAAVERARGQWE
jgi:hypothetical protein